MSRERAIGTAWEQRIADFLIARGFIYAERRVRHGVNDKGDITGIPGVVIEAKRASRFELSEWWKEAVRERANAAADIAAVWFWRRGNGPGSSFVLMDGDTFANLLREAGYSPDQPRTPHVPGQLDLGGDEP